MSIPKGVAILCVIGLDSRSSEALGDGWLVVGNGVGWGGELREGRRRCEGRLGNRTVDVCYGLSVVLRIMN